VSVHHAERPYIIIDGFNVFLRHYFANQEMNSKSQPIGGVIGFMKHIDYLTGNFCPSKIFVVWENGGPSARRKKICPEYKANRAKIKEIKNIQSGRGGTRDALALDDQTRIQQLTTLAQLLKNTPVCQVFVADTECDDIVAYLAKEKFAKVDAQKIIVSNDKDFYQLLDDPNVNIYDPATKSLVDGGKVLEKFGVSARNFCLAKTVVGDVSDNVNGVDGVGFKTLAKRFPSLSSIEMDVSIDDLIEAAGEASRGSKKPLKLFGEVAKSEDLLRRNWDLMYLNSSNLSASQLSKIDYVVDTHEPKMDKLGLIKTITEAGINTSFDYDRFCSQLRNFVR
jgi:DNA polymerase-1